MEIQIEALQMQMARTARLYEHLLSQNAREANQMPLLWQGAIKCIDSKSVLASI